MPQARHASVGVSTTWTRTRPSRVTYDVTVDLSAVGGDSYTNTAALTGSSLDDGDRVTPDVAPNPLERVYTAVPSAPNTISVDGSTPTKLADKSAATIGEQVTYTVNASIGANTNFYQTALVDTLPAGIDRSSINLVSATCAYSISALPCPGISGSLWSPGTGAGGDIVVFYGDIPADTDARTLTAVYTAVVSDVVGNVRGAPLNNSVNVRWDVTDDPDPTGLPYTWDRASNPATENVTVVEPRLVTSKAVSDPTPALTDTFTYTVTVRNTGSNLSNAYNVVVVDTVPDGIVPGTISNGGTFNTSTREITWDAADLPGPLAPNATLTPHLHRDLRRHRRRRQPARLRGRTAGQHRRQRQLRKPAVRRPDLRRQLRGRERDAPSSRTSRSPSRCSTAPPAYIGGAVAWQISGTNIGTGTAASVDVTDVLPPNWDFIPGTSSVVVGANPPVVTNPCSVRPGHCPPARLGRRHGRLPASRSRSRSRRPRPRSLSVLLVSAL